MTTVFKTSGRWLIVENITHAQILSEVTLLHPVGFYEVRVTGEEAKTVIDVLRAVGFIGNSDMLINPRRLVVAESEGAIARMVLEGASRPLIVPLEFLDSLDTPSLPAPETLSVLTGDPAAEKPRRKKSDK